MNARMCAWMNAHMCAWMNAHMCAWMNARIYVFAYARAYYRGLHAVSTHEHKSCLTYASVGVWAVVLFLTYTVSVPVRLFCQRVSMCGRVCAVVCVRRTISLHAHTHTHTAVQT
eukprot:GHVU01151036.1.p3 GENE.GHVU01151036.1~~GHVU01151036.1.p3  ORF type:complete len:114 (-),score=1.95 GHVU01151036.1:34-375(-)